MIDRGRKTIPEARSSGEGMGDHARCDCSSDDIYPTGIGQKRLPAEQRMLPRTQDRERGALEEKAAVGEEKKRGRTLAERTR